MELSQPRSYGSEGRKPTHDFLSLYSHSSAQQDPRPPSQGYNLKTHDFLQPLERVGKTCAKEEITSAEVSTVEKPPPPAPPPVEHVLPGGIGTYSISHISYFNPIRAPKPEGTVFTAAQTSSTDRNDENSHCSSYTGSGFTLWEESAAKKGKTGKENMRDKPAVLEPMAVRAGQWASSSERPSQSSSNNHHGSSFSSLSSPQPSGQRSQSFMEMIKSAKGSNVQEDEFEEENHFVLKKEISTATITHKELRVKVDGKSSDQKANTPRSKHSATEQRRRSKINDRFQMLRELIPHGDQKRDKASFLLEVIEYIQFLQDKVQKYEGPYQGWNNEQTKLMPWRNNRIGESFDHSQGMNSGSGPPLVFPTKFDEKPLSASPIVPGNAQNAVESDTSTATITNKGMSFPMSQQPNFFSPVRNGGAVAPTRLLSDVENASQLQSQLCQTRSCTTVDGAVASNKLKEEDLTIEGGTISISSAYSQGLLSTLTQALQSSGVDLSQASISVQIELGKRVKSRTAASTFVTKDNEIALSNQGMKNSRAPNADDSDQAQKKLKASKK